MKELSIEEKAQRYDEAIEKANELLYVSDKDSLQRKTIEHIFSELKESEDERIRKSMVEFFQNKKKILERSKDLFRPKAFPAEELSLCNNALIYLEKQGKQKLTPIFRIGDTIIAKDGTYIEKEPFHIDKIEDDCYWDGENTILVYNQDEFEIFEQKLVDKTEPKFKVGEWIVYNRDNCSREIMQIYDIRDNRYYFTDNIHFSWSIKECDEKSHLWSIQDAKDGDILFTKNKNIFIFESINGYTIYDYCGLYFEKFSDSPGAVNGLAAKQLPTDYVPATKEQCGLLFQKMHELGYEWDAEKKELKKISQRMVSAEAKEAMYSKPTWGEEVIVTISRAISIVKWAAYSDHSHPILNDKGATELIERLNSLKDRVQPQSNWKPSDRKTNELLDTRE